MLFSLKNFMRLVYTVAFLFICCFQVLSCSLLGSDDDWRAYRYIEMHKQLAIDEMFRMGVPASIKLAQGMLETEYGTSRLSNEGKNHFGIKCKDYWVGDTILVDDDAPQECFRRYISTKESYIDHSMFLRYHPKQNYTHLFELNPRDYFGWAYGLKEGGYATNPKYAEALIALIERYQLYTFDDYVLDQSKNKALLSKYTPYKVPAIYSNAATAQNNTAKTSSTMQTASITPSKQMPAPATKVFKPENNATINTTASKNTEKKSDDGTQVSRFIALAAPNDNSASPNAENQSDEDKLSIRDLKVNNIPALIANKDLSVFYIAYLYGIPTKKLYKYNEIELGTKFKAGMPIFLAPKQNQPAQGLASYTAQAGETLYSIAHRFGMKQKKLQRLNPQLAQAWTKGGETIKLRR
jgi:LysM repeat protein